MKYLIDTNCFVEPYRRICPIDVAVSFWESIKKLHMDGCVFLLDAVLKEIDGNDELVRWIQNNIPDSAKIKFESEKTALSLISVSKWAFGSHYSENAKDKFLDDTKADIYLVSYAAAYLGEYTVVTQETSHPKKTSEIKLPDACSHFGVQCCNLVGLYRNLNRTF